MNVLNGGAHASNSIDIQEFMLVPLSACCFAEALRMCAEVFHTLKKVIPSAGVGDEGGYAPNLDSDEDALKALIRGIETAGYKPGEDFGIAIDAAVTEWYSDEDKPKEIDISEAEVVVACGRGFAKESDLDMARELADLLGAQIAGTRPMIEAGWFDPKRQIGLSGRTVKPKLIITIGVSGSVQFAAGMKNSDCIVAINRDPEANIFDIAHVGLVGDLYEIVPKLIAMIKEGQHV